MARDRRVYVLEANANPNLSRDEDFADSAKAGVGWESGANRFSVEVAEETKDGFVSFGSRAGAVSVSLQGATVGKPGARVASNALPVTSGVRVQLVFGTRRQLMTSDPRTVFNTSLAQGLFMSVQGMGIAVTPIAAGH